MTNSDRNHTPAVTVIVPVCNSQRYLGECLEGLHAQTLQEMEILLIDDGSSDESPRMLAEAAARDRRMRVITKPNGGYGSGINRGLSEAKGRYIGIVESDDRVDAHMYEELYRAAMEAEEADIVKSSYWEYYDLPDQEPYLKASNLMNCMPKTPFTANIHEQYELLRHHPSIWTAIYRRAFLEAHQIRMMEEPGGGWVDNPFFFETFLQAQTYVWLPAAYYYYRQTNPDSSSNLKDCRMPYDRLRNLRDVVKRLNVKDPHILAYLYARHFFYTYSVIGEWGFSEKDPQVKALIREAMSALDPKILHLGNPGISPEYLSYYESIVKDPACRIRAHAACAQPKVSVIVPIYDDRHVLAATLSQLAQQYMEDFEVICADGDSEDLGPRIAESFANRDARFRVIKAGSQGYAAALSAGISQAKAPVIAWILPGQNVPGAYLGKIVSAMSHRVDLCVTIPQVSHSWCPWKRSSLVPVKGYQANLLLCVCDQPSRFAVRRSYLEKKGIRIRQGDENGWRFLSDVISSAGKAAVCLGNAPYDMAQGRESAREAHLKEIDFFRADRANLDLAYEAAAAEGGERLRAFRALAVHVLLKDLWDDIYADQGERIFSEAKEAWEVTYDLAGSGRMAYCNMDEFLLLEELLTSSYVQSLRLIARESAESADSIRRKGRMFKDMKPVRTAISGYHTLQAAGRKITDEAKKHHKP